MVKTGEEITVCIIEVDQKRERVSLVLNNFHPILGKTLKVVSSMLRCVKVVNLVPGGAFVELEEGVEGLVHVTEMSWTKELAGEVLNVGDEVDGGIGYPKGRPKDLLNKTTDVNLLTWPLIITHQVHGSGKIRNLTSYGAF